jgi:hypothetical protein
MPGLNKFIEKTGSRLPTPIIDLITVSENSIDVKVSLKFNFVDSILDNKSIEDFISEMSSEPSPIYVYVMYVLGKDNIIDLSSGKNKDPFTEMFSDENLPENTDISMNYSRVELPTVITERVFDEENGNLIVTLSATASFEFKFRIPGSADGNSLKTLFRETNFHDMSIFAFTSIIDFENSSLSYIELTTDITGGLEKTRKYNLPDSILEHMTSEVSHEDLYKDSELDVGTKSLFIDGENEPYHISPINSLDNKPYTQDGISSAEIREVFRLVTKSITAESEDLQEILNSIDLITETEDDKFLLQSYEKIRLAFPEKSTVTEMGRTYELFKTRLLGVDRRVKSSPLLTEQLYKTPKILDNRTIVNDENNIPEQDPGLTCLFANTTGNDEDEASWTNSIVVYEEAGSSLAAFSSFRRSGFCAFDYGLAQSQNAQILGTFPVAVLEELFGANVVDNYFKILLVGLYHYESSEITEPTSIELHEVTNANFPSIDHSSNTQNSLDEQSYLQIRGVYNLDQDERILWFQFQHLMDEVEEEDSIPTDDHYKLIITVEDNTQELIEAITSAFRDYYEGEFKEFFDYASEDCNYNKDTGYFNDFFVTGMKNKYSDTSVVFPWIKMPLLLEMYLNLFTQNEPEAVDLLKEKALAVSALINPINGTFFNLEEFKERCDLFDLTYFAQGEASSETITINFETEIHPPAPVAFIVGEGWEVSDYISSTETPEEAMKLAFDSLDTSIDYSTATQDSVTAILSEFGNLGLFLGEDSTTTRTQFFVIFGDSLAAETDNTIQAEWAKVGTILSYYDDALFSENYWITS